MARPKHFDSSHSSPMHPILQESGWADDPFLSGLDAKRPRGFLKLRVSPQYKTLIAAVAALAAIAMILSDCWIAPRRFSQLDVARRRLADDYDPSSPKRQRLCESVEESLNSGSPQSPPGTSRRNEEGIGAAPAEGAAPTATSAALGQSESTVGGSVRVGSDLARLLWGGIQQTSAAGDSPRTSTSTKQNDEAGGRGSILRSLLERGPSPQRDQKPEHSGGAKGSRTRSQDWQLSTLASPDYHQATASATPETSGSSEQLTMAATQPHQTPVRPSVIVESPHCRLPLVYPEQSYAHFFDKDNALSPEFTFVALPAYHYTNLRELLERHLLREADMRLLASITENLMSSMLRSETKSALNVQNSRGLVLLGRRFLELDAAVSALGLLQVPYKEWWHLFVGKLPLSLGRGVDEEVERKDESTMLSRLVTGPAVARERNQRVMNRLLRALDLLKQGDRPSKEDLCKLKVQLVMSHYSQRDLRESLWNPESDKRSIVRIDSQYQ